MVGLIFPGQRMSAEGARVRLITRNGHDWSHRFPWIVESALKNRQQHFVIDGEAVQKDYSNRQAAPEPDAKS